MVLPVDTKSPGVYSMHDTSETKNINDSSDEGLHSRHVDGKVYIRTSALFRSSWLHFDDGMSQVFTILHGVRPGASSLVVVTLATTLTMSQMVETLYRLKKKWP
jgi:hypothetical protein